MAPREEEVSSRIGRKKLKDMGQWDGRTNVKSYEATQPRRQSEQASINHQMNLPQSMVGHSKCIGATLQWSRRALQPQHATAVTWA